MSVKPNPAAPGEWIVDCRPDGYKGKRVRVSFPGTEEQARDWEKKVMRRHVDSAPVTAKTLAGIYPLWKISYKIDHSVKTVDDAGYAWSHLKDIFGKLQPKVITRQVIENYKRARIEEGVKPRTINKELTYLSVMIKWAAT